MAVGSQASGCWELYPDLSPQDQAPASPCTTRATSQYTGQSGRGKLYGPPLAPEAALPEITRDLSHHRKVPAPPGGQPLYISPGESSAASTTTPVVRASCPSSNGGSRPKSSKLGCPEPSHYASSGSLARETAPASPPGRGSNTLLVSHHPRQPKYKYLKQVMNVARTKGVFGATMSTGPCILPPLLSTSFCVKPLELLEFLFTDPLLFTLCNLSFRQSPPSVAPLLSPPMPYTRKIIICPREGGCPSKLTCIYSSPPKALFSHWIIKGLSLVGIGVQPANVSLITTYSCLINSLIFGKLQTKTACISSIKLDLPVVLVIEACNYLPISVCGFFDKSPRLPSLFAHFLFP